MTWFRIDDNFDNHPKVLALPRGAVRLRAVGLWTQVGTWCARQLTDGAFAPEIVTEKGGTRADLRLLLSVGLWHKLGEGCGTVDCPEGIPGQHRFHDFLAQNPSRERVLADRAAAAERQRRAREKARGATKSPVSHGVTHGVVTPVVTVPPTRPDPTPIAAAAAIGPETPLPPPLVILRSALEARKLHVRWDGLNADHISEIEALITEHGDAALVAQALRDFQPNKPIAYAQGWLSGWRQLRKPGRLELVTPDPCPEPGHSGTTRHCVQCASERKAAR